MGPQEGRWRIAVTMLEVKEVLRLWLRGVPKKGIATQRGLDPKTVRRQIELAQECGLSRQAGEEALSEELLVRLAEKLRPPMSHPRGEGWQRCEESGPSSRATWNGG